MTEPLSREERARRARLAGLAGNIGVPIVIALLLALLLVGILLGIGPFSFDAIMGGTANQRPAGVVVDETRLTGKADRPPTVEDARGDTE